jgi:hypothetical protein
MRKNHRFGVIALIVVFICGLQLSNLQSSTSPSSLLWRDQDSSHAGQYLEDGIDFLVQPVRYDGSTSTLLIEPHKDVRTTKDIPKDTKQSPHASSFKSNSVSQNEAAATETLSSKLKINSQVHRDYSQGLSGTILNQPTLASTASIASYNDRSTLITAKDVGEVEKFRQKRSSRTKLDEVDSSGKEVNPDSRQQSATISHTGPIHNNESPPSENKSVHTRSPLIEGSNSTISSVAVSDQASSKGSNHGRTVSIRPNESFFWKGAQAKLCKRLEKELKKVHDKAMQASQHRNESIPNDKLRLNLQAPCTRLHEKHMHGNFVVGFYGMRLAAIAFDADFNFRCSGRNPEHVSGRRYLLWWFQTRRNRLGIEKRGFRNGSESQLSSSLRTDGYQNSSSLDDDYPMNYTLYSPSKPSSKNACSGMGKAALHYTTEYVRRDLRAMANELAPSIKGIDDVAIHFRCGDVLSSKIGKGDNNYGLLKFRAYRHRIPQNAKTIGIVTAPFAQADELRKEDRAFGELCQHMVSQLQSYLGWHFPNASIHMRNDPHETIPTVFARLILAKVTFCARSTFCLFPAVAAFGQSYVQRDGVAYFMDKVSEVYENIHLMDEPFLRSYEIRQRGFNSTVRWLIAN